MKISHQGKTIELEGYTYENDGSQIVISDEKNHEFYRLNKKSGASAISDERADVGGFSSEDEKDQYIPVTIVPDGAEPFNIEVRSTEWQALQAKLAQTPSAVPARHESDEGGGWADGVSPSQSPSGFFGRSSAVKTFPVDEEAMKFLQHVVYGQKDEAEAMLKANQELLLDDSQAVRDYSGKPIQGLTGFQAALCACDVAVHASRPEMCEMMMTYFDMLEDGRDEMQRQFAEIFPDGVVEHVRRQEGDDCFNFQDIFDAIAAAHPEEVTKALAQNPASTLWPALEKFREAFTEKSLSEQVFNPYHNLRTQTS